MKKIILFISIIFCAFLIVGCSSAPNTSKGDGYGSIDGDYPDAPGVYPDAPGAEPDYSAPSDKGEGYNKDEELPQAGQMTASAWSDIENFFYWKNLITKSENADENEAHYLASDYEIFNSKAPGMLEVNNMYKVCVLSDDDVVCSGAQVTIRLEDKTLFQGVTDINGTLIAYIKSTYDTNITVDVVYKGQTYTKTYDTIGTVTESNSLNKVINFYIPDVTPTQITTLDLALVVDTTGSMKDELHYLKVELQDIVERVTAANSNLEIRVALIFYRDEGDEYVIRKFDFDQSLETQYKNIQAQEAAGGGDTPEAVHTALTEAENLSWSENSAKMMIHVCDASPHIEAQYIRSVAQSTINLTAKGVRVIPVICSGSNHFTELVFRIIALYTGGTYTYITDHSGIGNDHTDQAVPNDVVVEYLNEMLIRLINEYLTGKDIPPVAYNAKNKHTISFDTQGGSKVNVQLVDDNGLVTKIENPTKEGYDFIGWVVKDSEYGLEGFFSFDTPITSSITLQAIWVESGEDYVLLAFFTCDGTRIAEHAIFGKPLNKPAVDPVKEGHTFLGWYTYEDGILTPYDFSQPVTNTVHLHAVFVKNE